jgi:phosphatidylinositol alpha-1,6-mannosyltransferase
VAAVTLDPRGGGIAVVSQLAREALARRAGGCEVLTLLDDGRIADSMRPGWNSRVEFGARVAARQALGGCSWLFFAHPSLARVQRFVPRPFRRPYVLFVHGIEAWRPLAAEEQAAYRGAAVCITNSSYTAQRAARENPDLPPLVPCPLALLPGQEAPRPVAWTGDTLGPRAVVLVGRMMAAERYKGHDALLDAWPAVRREVPDAQLVFAGDGDDLPRLRERAAALADDSVRFTGFLPSGQIDALYGRAAVFAMPSRGEGFGLVYLEAMAHGLPCIGSTHDAAREIIEHGATGFLVDQADHAGLANDLVRLLRDDRLRLAMGARGRRRLLDEFSFDHFARRLWTILDAAFEGSTAACTPARTA